MPVLDPESEAVLRRIERSVDVDDAWASVERRSRKVRTGDVTRRLLAAAAVVLLLGGLVSIRLASNRSDVSLDVGSQESGDIAPSPDLAPVATGAELPFLVPDASLGTIESMTVSMDVVTEVLPPGVIVYDNDPTTPAAIYASPDDAGPMVTIETTDSAPTTVGTGPSLGGQPFTAGPWTGTVEVTGSPGHEVRTVVVNDGDPAGELLVLTARQVDDVELVRLVAGLHRVEAGGRVRLADDSGLALVSDASPRPNNESWRGYWTIDGSSTEVIDYRETGAPRFVDRFAASPTMTRVTVGGRPGAVFESGGYTVFSWLPTAYDVVELPVRSTGPDAVARAAALGRGSRSVTGAELAQQFPGLMLAPNAVPAVAAPLQQGTPMPPGTPWSSFPLSTNPVSENDLRTAMTQFATCAWVEQWRATDAAGDANGVDAARAAIADAPNWAALPDPSWAARYPEAAEARTPPGPGATPFSC